MASRSWNRVELIGNLTRDPELRYTPNGAAVCTFSIATNRTYVSEGEKKEDVDFHRVVAWNKLAELCNQLLKKGNKVFLSGRLQNRSWEGQDGQQRQTTEIVAEDMIILTSKGAVTEDVSYTDDVSAPAASSSSSSASKSSSDKSSKSDEKASGNDEGAEDIADLDKDLPF